MKREYKVGDTIYAKGNIDHIDEYDTSLPYCVDFVNGTVWISSDNIIDELPTAEPVKPVLPKAVGEELDSAKVDYAIQDFDLYIRNIIDCANSAKASNHYYLNNANTIIKLADAWRYGWEAEKEVLYNVRVPHAVNSYFKKIDANYCIAGDVFYVDLDEDLAQFTEAEIKHYGLQDCEKEDAADD